MTAHAHAHDHPDVGSHDHAVQRRALRVAFVITAVFVVVEVLAGWAFSSLALAADAVHLVSDGAALGIALVAQQLVTRAPSHRHSYGWRRAEVLAAQANGVLLLAAAGWITVEAIDRFGEPTDVESGGLIVVAALGLVANLVSTVVLHGAPGQSMNVRAAALHTTSDALGSLGALAAGVVIAVGGSSWTWADPAASLAIAVLVVVSAVRLLRDTTNVLLEATPPGLEPAAVTEGLLADPTVVAVHDLHIWALAPGALALSAHVELVGPVSLHDAQAAGDRLKAVLLERFGVGHSTLELECHPCDPTDVVH